MGLVSLWKGPLFPHLKTCKVKEKTAVRNPKDPHTSPPCQHPDLEVRKPPGLKEVSLVYKLSHRWHFVTAAWADQDAGEASELPTDSPSSSPPAMVLNCISLGFFSSPIKSFHSTGYTTRVHRLKPLCRWVMFRPHRGLLKDWENHNEDYYYYFWRHYLKTRPWRFLKKEGQGLVWPGNNLFFRQQLVRAEWRPFPVHWTSFPSCHRLSPSEVGYTLQWVIKMNGCLLIVVCRRN